MLAFALLATIRQRANAPPPPKTLIKGGGRRRRRGEGSVRGGSLALAVLAGRPAEGRPVRACGWTLRLKRLKKLWWTPSHPPPARVPVRSRDGPNIVYSARRPGAPPSAPLPAGLPCISRRGQPRLRPAPHRSHLSARPGDPRAVPAVSAGFDPNAPPPEARADPSQPTIGTVQPVWWSLASGGLRSSLPSRTWSLQHRRAREDNHMHAWGQVRVTMMAERVRRAPSASSWPSCRSCHPPRPARRRRRSRMPPSRWPARSTGLCYAVWRDPSGDEANLRWLRETGAALAPLAIGHYVGEADLEDRARLRGCFSPAAWDRLSALRARYDPAGVFLEAIVTVAGSSCRPSHRNPRWRAGRTTPCQRRRGFGRSVPVDAIRLARTTSADALRAVRHPARRGRLHRSPAGPAHTSRRCWRRLPGADRANPLAPPRHTRQCVRSKSGQQQDRYFQEVGKTLKTMVRPAGFEPTTDGLEIRCSIQLS